MNAQRARRIHRVRTRLEGTAERPRLAVFRSLKHISAQIIDDAKGVTLVAAHSREAGKDVRGVAVAEAVGKMIAERAVAKGVKQVVFDRRSYRYHGQVKALADGARGAGLVF